MGLPEILLIALGLAMDAFAVSLGAGASGHARSFRPIFRLSFHFGLFQFLMPVCGWYLGRSLARVIASWDHWIALALLGIVGGRMIWAGLRPEEHDARVDPTRGATLVMLAVATSIDALAVGLSLAMLGTTIWYPSVVIGIVAASLSVVGAVLGHRLSQRLGSRMEIVGGVILVAIGIRILVSHLTP